MDLIYLSKNLPEQEVSKPQLPQHVEEVSKQEVSKPAEEASKPEEERFGQVGRSASRIAQSVY